MDNLTGGRVRLCVILVVILTLSSGPLFPQQDPPLRTPADGGGEWRVGVAIFEPGDLPDEYIYLIRSIPGSILNLLEGLDTHYLDTEEIRALRERIIESEIEEVEKHLAEAREQASQLLFSGEGNPKKRERSGEEYDDRIQAFERKIEELKAYDPQKIEVSSRRELSLVRAPGGGGLLTEEPFSPAGTVREHDLDMYIYGKVEEIEGVVFFETRVWNAVLEEDERVIQKAAEAESLNLRIEEMLREVKESVYGREWAELIVETEPEDSEVRLDGEFLGTGVVSAETLEPGSHLLEVRRRGYLLEKRTLFLRPSESERVTVRLSRLEEDEITVRSRPAGADAYLDAVWIGSTPLSLPRPPGVSQLILKKDSFAPKILLIDETFTDEVVVGLSPLILDREKYIEEKRDTFYRTAGFFVLSFPFPFFLYSMSMDYAAGYGTAAKAGNTSEAARLQALSNGFYHGFLGGLVISVSLLAHTIYTLVDYIQAADSSR